MKRTVSKSLLVKTTILIGLIIFGLLSVLLTIFSTISYNNLNENIKIITKETAGRYAESVKSFLQESLDEARALKSVYQGIVNNRDTIDLSREESNQILKAFIEDNPSYLGVYVLFEPDQFDHRDEEYKNSKNHDSTGRYIPYLYLDGNGQGSLDILLDYEEEFSGWYQDPKRTNRETIQDPFLYPIEGVDVLMTSLTVPIQNRQGEFIGIAGIDVSIDTIAKMAADLQIEGFNDAHITVLSQNGVIAGSRNENWLGQPIEHVIDQKEYIEQIKKGEAFATEIVSEGNLYSTYGVPVEVGNTESNWLIVFSVSRSEIYAPVNRMIIIFIVIGILVLLLIISIIFFIIRNITKNIDLITKGLKTISEGDLTKNIDINRSDEIGYMGHTLHLMRTSLSDIVTQVRNAAIAVTNSSGEVNETAQSLSSGATEQAASAEEVSASMEEMASTIMQNSDNAKRTEVLARNVSADAEESGAAVKEAVAAMTQIAEKISIIEEIARQTNLLALNAAIEAARAGEAGKGFAVVAQEVRRLAERSQNSANEISDLSSNTVKTATRAGELLNELVPRIRETASLVQEISTANEEQNTGVIQINSALLQLDKVVQQNAAASEEMAATASILEGHALDLNRQMSFFTTNETQLISRSISEQ